jgi:hypothetical protein
LSAQKRDYHSLLLILSSTLATFSALPPQIIFDLHAAPGASQDEHPALPAPSGLPAACTLEKQKPLPKQGLFSL